MARRELSPFMPCHLRRYPGLDSSGISFIQNTMSKAIIAPSVLASDLSNLTAECKRMISEGADWLHMGTFVWALFLTTMSLTVLSRRHGRVSHTPAPYELGLTLSLIHI